MVLSAANVFVRDVMQAVPILLTFWMFTTPVFYDPLAILSNAQAAGNAESAVWAHRAANAFHYNPMAILIQIYRAIFSYGQTPFPVVGLVKLAGVSAAVLWLGYAYFLRSKGRFADEV
jgi:ABC-type polysaccharide/polyol phosphate export permease